MNKIFLAVILLPAVAFGASQSVSQTQTVTPPSATGSPHACGVEWYPPAALAAGEEGKTTLSFRVGVDGGPKGISVAATSGSQDLDQAAIKCATGWKYLPATQNGKPYEVDWKAAVEWSMAARQTETIVVTRGSRPPSPAEMPAAQQPIGSQVCKNPMAPPAPLGKATVVFFRLDPDGSTENLKLFKSSGDDKLDELALSCASQWRFTPSADSAHRGASIMVVPIPW